MSPPTELEMAREADRLLSEAYAPPGVIVDEHLQVIHFRGRTGAYLEPAAGEANYDLLPMVRDELRRAVSVAVDAARESNRISEVRAHLDRAGREVKVRAAPLGDDASQARPLLVVFDEAGEPSEAAPMAPAARGELSRVAAPGARRELEEPWHSLQSVIETCRARQAELEAVNRALATDNSRLSARNAELEARAEECRSDLDEGWAGLELPIIVLTRELAIRSFSPATSSLSPLLSADVGRPLSHINLGLGSLDVNRLVASVLETEQAHTEEVKDASGRWHRLHVQPYRRREELQGVVLLFVDITDLRQAGHEAILARNRADACPDEFLAILSHELRNPLAPIAHAAAFLRHARGLEPAAQEAAAIITRKAEQMARVLDKLLDVSRLSEHGLTLERQPVDLRGAIHRAVEAARPLLDTRRHELSVSVPREPLVVDADPKRLEQVLGHLLANAAKYTPPGGQIRVDAILDGAFALVRVKDSGMGISADMLPRVFGLFTQADRSLDRTGAGLGIGLSVVQRLVRLHGGSVAAHSDGEGKGSEFILRWPLGKSTFQLGRADYDA